MKLTSAIITGLITSVAALSATPVSATIEEPTKVAVFSINEDGSRYYRIPAIVTAADGSLVALADKRGSSINDLPNTISVVAKRSTDNGRTWSSAVTIAQGNSSTGKTYGDPAVVLDRNTGKLVAVFSGDKGFFGSTPTNRAGFYVSTSSDNGLTWTEPRAITNQIYQSNWYGAFCASGSLLQTADGKLMFVANTRTTAAQSVTDVYEFVCCSSDGGETWSVLNPSGRTPAAGNGNESKLVETSDGTLIMSIRSANNRRFAKSTDGGYTWGEAEAMTQLIEPDCNGDIIVYPSTDGQTRMLHSLPSHPVNRRDVSVYLSYDEGKTWPVKKQLVSGSSAYSSLTVLPDGSIGCFVEEGDNSGFNLYFHRFSLEWLTDGADTGNNTEGHTITIETPDASRATISVFNGDEEIHSGRKVPTGTTLTIQAQGVSPYIVTAVKVNGTTLQGNSFVVEGPTTIAAVVERDPNAAASYTEPTGSGDRAGTAAYVKTASTSGAKTDITITRTGKNGTWYELCDDATIEVTPGQEFSLRLQGNVLSTNTSQAYQDLRYCVAYVFTDWDGDGTFELATPTDDRFTKGYYGYFNNESGFGGNIKANYDYILDFTHNFTVPADARIGASRIRVIYTEAWDKNVPSGNVTGNYQAINKGYAYDYLVNCVAPAPPANSVSYNCTVRGNGEIRTYTDLISYASNEPDESTLVENGGYVRKGSFLYLYALPGKVSDTKRETLLGFEATIGTFSILDTPYFEENSSSVLYPDMEHGRMLFVPAQGDINVLAVFSDELSGIADLLFDGVEGPTEYFDLNGRPVNPENTATGVYIMRRGGVTKKVYISK
ncbi:MAG: glycoside hydrolase [Firmicutes bacterium]|nr:glycoside hydrolase [Bacillota bacterium]MCM1400629.1 glycoside hydrolase [Bacteroides sp.]MCM1477776.1 glycoside hydrolase [Bacteroides sp.]